MPLFEAFENGCYAFWITSKQILIAECPKVTVDERRRLHSEVGPAFTWLRDIQDYYWHGVHVPALVVNHPSQITAEMVDAEKNAEVRRVMIERFPGGVAAYLTATKSEQIHADDYGVLYRKEMPNDEPLVMVKVVNSTQEPDGTFKDYFLRVPPTMKTAKEAVAWTFGKTEEEYAPLIET